MKPAASCCPKFYLLEGIDLGLREHPRRLPVVPLPVGSVFVCVNGYGFWIGPRSVRDALDREFYAAVGRAGV